jgi:hypothetical protein
VWLDDAESVIEAALGAQLRDQNLAIKRWYVMVEITDLTDGEQLVTGMADEQQYLTDTLGLLRVATLRTERDFKRQYLDGDSDDD